MTRSWLLFLVATFATGCGADSIEPVRGQPQLIEVTPTDSVIVLRSDGVSSFEPLSFDAELRSDDAGDRITGALLINYGTVAVDGVQPWESATGHFVEAPGTSDVPRTISLPWDPPAIAVDRVECKRVTMVVSHTFLGMHPFAYCPTADDDVARLAWSVALCGASVPDDECTFDACDAPGEASCPAPTELQQAYDELTGD